MCKCIILSLVSPVTISSQRICQRGFLQKALFWYGSFAKETYQVFEPISRCYLMVKTEKAVQNRNLF